MSGETWGMLCFQMLEQIFNTINMPLGQNKLDYVSLYCESWLSLGKETVTSGYQIHKNMVEF